MKPSTLLACAIPLLTPSLAAARPDDCGACTVEDGAARLCEPHVKAEQAVLAAQGPRVLDKDGAAAMDALEVLAAANAAHENAPSPAITRAIAKGLQHEAYPVRAYAMSLLVAGQDEGATREALRAFAAEFARDAMRLDAEVDAGYAARLEQTPRAQDEFAAQVGALREALGAVGSESSATFLQQCCRMMSDYLGQRDDAALDELVAVAKFAPDYSAAAATLGPALARQGRRDAVLAAVEIAKAWQARLKDLQSALKKAEKLELAPRPRDFSGSSADWKQRAKVQREQTVARFRMRVEQHETTGRALHDALNEMARSRGLGDVPAWNEKLHAAWSSWLARHKDELPERLAPAPAND